jgi:branched-chain amino acid transport system ATP-binding protein
MSVLLRVHDLAINYGHIEAVKGITFHLNSGEITALVGANGAGKSTTLLGLSGLLRPVRGRILFEDEDITRLSPHEIVRRGVVQVAEGRAILTTLTVNENLALGAYTRRDRAGIADSLEQVFHLFPRLRDRGDQLAGNLSGGEQQMLAIGRALMAKPRLLLLDEPSMGLAPLLVQEIFKTLVEINRSGLTVLLVEQNVRQALKIARHGYVIETGQVVLADSGANLLHDPRVAEAYLGG